MIPYPTRPKLSDFYTLSQTKLLLTIPFTAGDICKRKEARKETATFAILQHPYQEQRAIIKFKKQNKTKTNEFLVTKLVTTCSIRNETFSFVERTMDGFRFEWFRASDSYGSSNDMTNNHSGKSPRSIHQNLSRLRGFSPTKMQIHFRRMLYFFVC